MSYIIHLFKRYLLTHFVLYHILEINANNGIEKIHYEFFPFTEFFRNENKVSKEFFNKVVEFCRRKVLAIYEVSLYNTFAIIIALISYNFL